MKFTLHLFPFLICLTLFNATAFGQKYTIDDFYKVDSLANQAQPKDALAIIDKMTVQARAEGNSSMLIKSVIYKMLFQQYLEENAFDKILIDLRKDISLAKQPEKSILQSLLAETYWRFYQANQWRISQRTNVNANIGDDINTWSLPKLTEEITKTFLSSLQEITLLQNTKVDVLDKVLTGDKYNRSFRPTLYDLLAHRALDVFSNTQIDITQANKSDSTSFYSEALQIFKSLLIFHHNRQNQAALADVELKRLKFIWLRDNNYELYTDALKNLAEKSLHTEVYADVLYELASLYKNHQAAVGISTQNLVKAVEMGNKAIAAFPNSIGAINSVNLIKQIKSVELTTQTKAQLEPHKTAQLHLSYKNLDTIYFKLYKRPLQDRIYNTLNSKKEFFGFLAKNEPLKQWFIIVPKTADYHTHSLVATIDPLNQGNYLLISQNRLENSDQTFFSYSTFNVSAMIVTDRLVHNTTHEFFVTNSTSGAPMKGVTIRQRRASVKAVESAPILTNELGYASTNEIQQINSAIVSLGNDSLLININNYNRSYKADDEKKVILFTDRPIYRPGQTVFYKGLYIGYQHDKNLLLTNEIVEIALKDVNGKEIEKKELRTNEFGTFQGSFTIPLGKLNGLMKLETPYGGLAIQVEEYKRPTFEVVFDKLTQRYQLNDSVKVFGKAVAFAGYSVSDTKASYKVFRRAIYDYGLKDYDYAALYGSMAFNRQQVSFGNMATGADGKFELSFFAEAPNERLNYSFEIEVTVTDVNGETSTKSTTINAGKKDISLIVNNSAVLFASSKTDSIPFLVTNLNHEPIKANLKAEWFLLEPPTRLTNKSPFYAEKYTLSKEEFIKTFPTDDYDREFDFAKWPVSKSQYQQSSTADKGRGRFTFNQKQLTPGHYKVIFSAINDLSDTIAVERFVVVYGPEPSIIKSSSEWIVPESNIISPGESAVFRLAGLSKNSRAYYELYYKNRIEERVWLNLSPKQTVLKIKPKASYKDGFALQFTMVENGTIYNSLQQVYFVDPASQLDIKFLTFRNKLQPGEKESWKLQISNRHGEKEMAEMVATLYDASLDNFKTMSWNTSPRSNYDYHNYTWKLNANNVSYGNYLWFLNTYNGYSVKPRVYENLNLFGYNYYGGYNQAYRNYIDYVQFLAKRTLSQEAVNKLATLAKGTLIYGVVYDSQGYTIPGARVRVGKLSSTATNLGVYAIAAKVGDELTVSFLGYKPFKVKVGKNRRIDVRLKNDGSSLNEVVVTSAGSSIQRKMEGDPAVPLVLRGSRLGANELKAKGIVEDNTIYSHADMISYAPNKSNIVPRTNFNETAFFYPQLRTDENGEIKIEFTIPQSLTRYKMMGFAHTKDLKTATISNELITQKELAISANAPRFFREGDTILFSAKLNNLSGKNLKGEAELALKNALTGRSIQLLAKGDRLNQDFTLANEGNTVLKWNLIIPSGVSAITYTVVANAGKFSDGEEMTIPVLPNSMLVTESMPINVRGNASKTFNMEKLITSGSSKTIRNQALTFEFTANPIWYAIQALPYLMEYPYECAEQTFSRFYANSFAAGIINSSPRIKEIFHQWQQTQSGEALLSNLEKNPELKSILLEETPWVRQVASETERKKRLATLFDLNRMTYELKSNLEKLEKMQYSDGSFPWFTGMQGNRYITQHIVLGIGQLKKLKLIDDKVYPALTTILNKAIIYLDKELVKDYNGEIAGRQFGYMPLHYLYARSYTNQLNNDPAFVKAKDFYLKKLAANWKTFDSYQLGQTALVLYRSGNKVEPLKIMTLLKQTAQQSDEMGMFWAKNTSGWWWYQSPIETQSLLIEAFDEVAGDVNAVEEMKIWLLKHKQTNDWKTTKATAAACYALLMKGYDSLSDSIEPVVLIGGKTIADLGFANAPKEAGTGYQKIAIAGADVSPEMGKVAVKNNNKSIAWGALYWQYFEQLDKITPANAGVKIKKQLFIQNSSIKGNILNPLTSNKVLSPGDLVKVRIEIYNDRDMEYVHLKDMRSAGFEPVNAISRYKYQDGLGYYESTKDASTNFFMGYMRKGTYVFEYELRVTHAGNFSNGITTLQCMYAPEFTTHSEGTRVSVR
ncbi:alpha-2-macroglobulin family protein [Pedobacter insulae]|uniref:CarboxypepD_reg-like domain-containing protein n=1 Tax=Pedobacter insulae TaxID=414048 RepID=A0A1I2XCY6_9SPHI|nr:MG2 domain-containing protein [Pedobacter insulae]SFH10869.1 CarboxypepD_reg-like domain-containing protein [Pedobacter insulae]